MRAKLQPQMNLTAAKQVRDAFSGSAGVFGVSRTMPEERAVSGIPDELDRVLLVTSAVAIDYMRSADALWTQMRALYDGTATRWVFDPARVAANAPATIRQTLEQKGTLRYPNTDAQWWQHNARTWSSEYAGDPRVLFQRCSWNAVTIGKEIRVPGRFRGLGGCKIFPLWLRMLSDIEGYKFKEFDRLPIPVDIHIARATFTVGLVAGQYEGAFDEKFKDLIRSAWRAACASANEDVMSFDEPLWHLGKLGCRYRHSNGATDCARRGECPIGRLCPAGQIAITSKGARIDVRE